MCLFFFDACGNKRKKRGKHFCFPLFLVFRVEGGTRTHDIQNHNLTL